MQDSTFIGLDVHKATISVAVAQGERGGEVRHWGSVPHRPGAPALADGAGSSPSRWFLPGRGGRCA